CMRLPEAVQMNNLCRANRRPKISFRAFDRQAIGYRDGTQPRRRWRHDRHAITQPAESSGHPENTWHHPAVADRVKSIANVQPAPSRSRESADAGLNHLGPCGDLLTRGLCPCHVLHLELTCNER